MTPAQCRAARALLDITQSQLAHAAGLGLSTVVDFEKERRTVSEGAVKQCRSPWSGPGSSSSTKTGEGLRLRKPRHPRQKVVIRVSEYIDPHIVLELRHVLLGRGFLESDQGSMNLASNTAPLPATMPWKVPPSSGAQGDGEVLDAFDGLPGTALVRVPIQASVTGRAGRSGSGGARLGLASFLPPERTRAASSAPMMMRASEPPKKCRRSGRKDFLWSCELVATSIMTPLSPKPC